LRFEVIQYFVDMGVQRQEVNMLNYKNRTWGHFLARASETLNTRLKRIVVLKIRVRLRNLWKLQTWNIEVRPRIAPLQKLAKMQDPNGLIVLKMRRYQSRA